MPQPNTQDAFKKAYATLNEAQKKAVDTIDGPVMVIAGPGTGKTQILTLRIANILLKTDIPPAGILALTFTDSGARAMKERLASLIGETAYDVGIFTFHGFADYLIQLYPEAYPDIIGGRAATDIERIQIIENILEDTSFTALRPSGDPAYYVKPIRDAIVTLKQEYITPDIFSESISIQEKVLGEIEQYHTKGVLIGKERGEYTDALKHLTRNQELLSVYRLYESTLRSLKLYDFGDMITKTVDALSKNDDMLRDLQEQYQYVLADEHQDVNGSQNKILELLVHFHQTPNLFVVGDEKQAIYRFQGASLDNFLYFENTFGKATTISLTENYRSGQSILDIAHDVIKTDDEVLSSLRIPLVAKNGTDAVVEEVAFPHEAIEMAWIIDSITRKIEEGISPDEIAIIVRTNKEVELFSNALRKVSIAAAPSADSDILEHPVTESVFKLLKAVVFPTDETALMHVLHEPYWNIPVSDLAVLLSSRNRTTPLTTLVRDTDKRNALELQNESAVEHLVTVIDTVRAQSTTQAPHRLLESLLAESGLINHVLVHDPFEGVRIVRRIYDEVDGMVRRKEVRDLREVLERLELHQSYGIALSAPFIAHGHKAVEVMTAHKSKGLEFEVVYIPHLTDKTWGSKQSRELFKLPVVKHDVGDFDVQEDDERRLFYVAITRAKKSLICTRSIENSDGKQLAKSRFLSDFKEGGTQVVETDSFVDAFSAVADIRPLVPLPITTELILEALEERGFSPTAFNNYQKSPWEYFYRNVLRVPQIKTTELQYGTAIHFVLDEILTIQRSTKDTVSATTIRELLNRALAYEALSDEEFTRLHERGFSALVTYVEHLLEQANSESRTEVHLEGYIDTGIEGYPQLKLNGTLDRVDVKDGVIIRVVDYKTGRPKTRGEIEGSTKTSNGEYKRQLVFYALLLSLQSDTSKHCRTGVLSFVEPDKNGAIKEETFIISDEEIATLKEELILALREIIEGKALFAPCDPLVCHYCDLVAVWQK